MSMISPSITIHSLAMLKMEKNFIAHNEKEYPRQPYLKYSLGYLIERLKQEVNELEEASDKANLDDVKRECADVSNIVDYIFEQLCIIDTHKTPVEDS